MAKENVDSLGRELELACVCGSRLPVDSQAYLCHHCTKEAARHEERP